MQICIESAQRTLKILSLLHDERLLSKRDVLVHRNAIFSDSLPLAIETFLMFDLDATFIPALVLLMAAAIDSPLLCDHSPWSQRAYALLDGMIFPPGNRIAEANKKEPMPLEAGLGKMIVLGGGVDRLGELPERDSASTETIHVFSQPTGMSFLNGFDLIYELSAEQLTSTANSLDRNGIDWAFLNTRM